MTRLLLLAGTTEATALAERLHAAGYDVISSFAGVTRERAPRPGHVRVGGFGGVAGLERYLFDEGIDAVIDATHPFAAQMPFNACQAAEAAGVDRCRVLRAPWVESVGDRWTLVDSVADAPAAVRRLGARRVLLTVGRQSAAAFASTDDLELITRSIEAPAGLPASTTIVLDRGPFAVDDEIRLLIEQRVEAIVAKNSGGTSTSAKLTAARELGLPVVMVRRPLQPEGLVVETLEETLAWLTSRMTLSQE